MTKEKLILRIIGRLKKEYPDTGYTLDYDHTWKLLVSARLAAQYTDVRVNVVAEGLYARCPDVNTLAETDVEGIERTAKPCGPEHSKVRDIGTRVKMLREQYKGKAPDGLDILLRLPGVGRKSANLIVGDVFGKPTIVTDTHCIRLVNRMGLMDGIKEPEKTEMALWKPVPSKEGNDFCHRLVFHGRNVCTARIKSHCESYCLNDIRKKVEVG